MEDPEGDGAARSLLQLEALQRAAADVVSTRDLDEVLARCIDHARQMAGAPSGAIYLRDERGGVLRLLIARETGYDKAQLPVEQIQAALGGRGSFACDLEDPRNGWHPDAQQAAGGAGRPRLGLNVAMRWHDRLMGLVTLAWPERVTIAEATLRALEALMVYQAAAIENARTLRLLERRAQLAQVVRDFSRRALTVGDEEALHRLIVDTALQILGAHVGGIGRIRGVDVEPLATRPVPLATLHLDDPLIVVALARSEPHLVEDLAQAPAGSLLAEEARRHGCTSVALAALRRGEEVERLVIVGSQTPQRWSAEESEALEMMATIAVEALERARVQQAEARERRRLDATLEHLPIGVMVIDHQGKLLHNNRASSELAALLGTGGDAFPEELRKLRKPDGTRYDMNDSIAGAALRGEPPVPRDLPVVGPSGRQLVIRAVGARLDEPGQPPAVVLGFSDVTELFELAAAKDRFLRVASHELRSPVTALRATAQLLVLDPAAAHDEERRRTLYERIDRQSARLVKLVAQLLDSARLQSEALPLEVDEVDLAALAREVAEAAGPRVQLVAPAALRGRWDESRLEQVMTNLLSNALQYSPPDQPVVLRLAEAGERVIITVEDRGVGIPPGQLEQVFTPFFRGAHAAGRHKSGMGLGLHITSEIVRRHGGTIRVRSQPQVGSTFIVELPRGV